MKITPELMAEEVRDSLFEKLIAYKVTEFGRAIAEYGIQKLGIESPEVQRLLEETRIREDT